MGVCHVDLAGMLQGLDLSCFRCGLPASGWCQHPKCQYLLHLDVLHVCMLLGAAAQHPALGSTADQSLLTPLTCLSEFNTVPEQDETTEARYNNLGAVAVLSAPNWSVPHFLQYEADLPRPSAKPYYDIDIPGALALSCSH